MNYRYYLFDFDGTLVDSMPTYMSAMLNILDEEGVAYDQEIMKTITPLGYVGTAKYYIEQLGVKKTAEELIGRMYQYALPEYVQRIPAKAHVIPVLQALKARGCSLNVLTASPHETLDPCLKRLGIFELFDHVWSCEDFSTTKADPEIYRRAAQLIGAPISQILFLDDNYHADLCARRAGINVCGVFDPSSAEFEQEIRQVCHGYIRDFSELLRQG